MAEQYKTNPLSDVIVRIDFLNAIDELSQAIPKKLAEIVKTIFPITESRELVAKELQISKENIKHKEERSTEWNFFNQERTKRFSITNKWAYIVYYRYEGFENLVQEFNLILNNLYEIYNELQVNRLGLRYINKIQLKRGLPYNWSGYLNKNLLCIFKVADSKENIIRAFHNLELIYDDFNLKFQYGMHNPDYPAPIKKKIFILDFDAYYGGLLQQEDIQEFLPRFHEKIQYLFEKSITDKYRSILNEQ